MSRIRSKDTKPEIIVRKFLYSSGLRYRIHVKNLPGKPDIVLTKYKTVIFIHGCFWHGHSNCKYFKYPSTRADWWLNKINNNKEKDLKHITFFQEQGWRIIVIWECQLKPKLQKQTLDSLLLKF